MSKTKVLRITQKKTENGTETHFETKGLNDFEILGMLTYYKDAFSIKIFKETNMEIPEQEESKTDEKEEEKNN